VPEVDSKPYRIALIDGMIVEFQTTFPEVQYESDLQSLTINAQAFCRGDQRVVRVYGGLALDPSLSVDALRFALLHETGHHRASGPRLATDPMLACECAADVWAVTSGVAILAQRTDRQIDLSKALSELGSLTNRMAVRTSTSINRRGQRCWYGSWSAREKRLREKLKLSLPPDCFFL
jgi:hypothetical protein